MPRPLVPDRRRRILDAARRLTLEKGWPDTTVADIAAGAGIGKGAVYREFPDKSAVMAGVLNRGMRELTANVRRRTLEAEDVVDLVAMYRFGVDALLADPLMRVLYLGDQSVLGDQVRDMPTDRYLQRVEWLKEYADQLHEAGVIDPELSTETVVRLLSVFTVGLVHAPGVLGATTPEQLSETVELFADMLRRRLGTGCHVDPEVARTAQLNLLAHLDQQLAKAEGTA